ncbi:hypothetical protein Z517_08943 [Fonsecaea pedrosoi CBS 271.37]|uniref:Unplaced genomic scaffold supercont1.5, whole genome shotgun sequence n=1 Tax=Fonsecaea pedrosoi CBS 271.37 TaxID=1442368 RepID=A0A0D2GEC1_9EURO|nr:uncharacterized protein Z517_08943 [Fonsecaea pedrosoi CBS 271.37]KIW79103.1 hypothetical protein Z517_08943 [Fonsecaea pedrosoi CBS 271.37]
MPPPLATCAPHTNPHYSYGKGDSDGLPSCSQPNDLADPCGFHPLLLRRVPSASLYPEEMLAQWSSNLVQPSVVHSDANDDNIYTKNSPQCHSVPSNNPNGHGTSHQALLRPTSLLPPAPRFTRSLSDTGKVECRLISTGSSKCHETNTDSTSTAESEPLKRLTAQIGDVSLEQETLSTPPTSPITPVPSLTTSCQSRSSFAISDRSPCTAVDSSQNYFESLLPQDSDNVMASSQGKYETSIDSRAHGIRSPLSRPLLYQEDPLCWALQPTNLSSGSNLGPSRHILHSELGATTSHLPHVFERQKEVSYIDWDDEDDHRSYRSPLMRIKKSFTDLRAAERFIAEANVQVRRRNIRTRRQMTTNGLSNLQHDETREANRQYCHNRQSVNMSKDKSSLAPRSSKLRKRPSTNMSPPAQPRITSRTVTLDQPLTKGIDGTRCEDNDTLSALPHDTSVLAPPTPPSTGKRKRANTTTSERSEEVQKKKKPKLGVVGKLVSRLLGAKKGRSSTFSDLSR